MRFQRSAIWICLVVAGLTAGCAGNGDGLNQNGQPIGSSSSSGGSSGSSGSSSSSGGGSGSGGVTADFQSIQDNVFTPICSKCHSGAGAPEGLQLDAAHSYNLLVGVPSVEESNLLRVKPGDPDDSYMILKIEGAPGIDGGQMPLGETPLPQATIDAMRQWVTDGAMKSQTASLATAIALAAGRAFNVETTAPLDRAVATAPLRQIVVSFTRDLDASLVNDTTVTLAQLDTQAAAMAANPIPMVAAPAAQNQSVLLITPGSPLPAGSYRVTLRGSGAAALADVDGAVLGSDFSFIFKVEPAP
jgi:hypothetical protein